MQAKLLDEAKEYITKFEEAMDDDCNTAFNFNRFELVKFANSNQMKEAQRICCRCI